MQHILILLVVLISNLPELNGAGNEDKCPNLSSMFTEMSSQAKDFTFQCKHDGIRCSIFSCNITVENTTRYALTGSWLCQNEKPAFKFTVMEKEKNKTNILSNSNPSVKMTLGSFQLEPKISFTEMQKDGEGFQFNLTVQNTTNNVINTIVTKRNDFVINCNCSNVISLQTQVQSKFNVTDMACWGTNISCNTFYCDGHIEKPESIHFSFQGIGYCTNNKPAYNFSLSVQPNEHIISTSHSFHYIGTDKDVLEFSMKGGKYYHGELEVDYTITTNNGVSWKTNITNISKKNGTTTRGVTVPISISFYGLPCASSPLTTITPSKTSAIISTAATPKLSSSPLATKNIPTTTSTTPSTTTKKMPSTIIKISPSTTTTTITSATTKPIATAKPTSTKGKATNSAASHPAKVVLIILSVVIILSVFLIGVYLKKKKRLSNQPAYYNDIALNDPLRYELEEDEDNDDDELPLFT